MADSLARRNLQLNRLRHRLRQKRESLADQFEFKMYIIFHFKEKKPDAVYEVNEVITVMANNYEECILKEAKGYGAELEVKKWHNTLVKANKREKTKKGISLNVRKLDKKLEKLRNKEDTYSVESSKELLDKDIVQMHASQWHSLRKDVLGTTADIDFFLWPRKDIDNIECLLFSRWKGDLEPYKPLQATFQFTQDDYEKQLSCLHGRHNKTGLILNNPSQTLFLFVDRYNLQTKSNKATIFKLSSLCVYLPQDRLLAWGPGCPDDVLKKYLVS